MKDALYNARLDAPSVLPELDAAALPAKAGELAAKGDAAITRAGAAQLVFDLLTAENKNEAYRCDTPTSMQTTNTLTR